MDSCRRNTSLYIACLFLYNFPTDLMLGVAYNTIFRCGIRRVMASKFVIVDGSQDLKFSVDRYHHLVTMVLPCR